MNKSCTPLVATVCPSGNFMFDISNTSFLGIKIGVPALEPLFLSVIVEMLFVVTVYN
jgi:hypothetical protein